MTQNAPITLSVSVIPTGSFNSSVSVTVSGLPAHVTSSPASFTIAPGASQTVTLTAASAAATGSANLTLNGTSGSLSHSASASVQIAGVLNTRIRYFSTASEVSHLAQFGPIVIYNALSRRFFFTDALQNQIFVFDANGEKQLSSVFVPGAGLLDQAPDGSAVYVATNTGDIYVVDPNALTVTARIIASTIGSAGYKTSGVFALADGRFVLVGDQVGVPSSEGYNSFAIWDRSSNSLTKYVTSGGIQSSLAGQSACGSLSTIGNIALNAARTKVFLGGYNTDPTICQFDPAAGQSVTGSGGQPSAVGTVLPTPDGTRFLTFGYGNVYIWDASTMAVTDQFALPTYFSAGSGVLSKDGTTLYIVATNTGVVLAFNWRTHALLGWANEPVANLSGDLTPMAIDETGLIGGTAGGIADGGFGFADVSSLQTGPYLGPDSPTSAMRGPFVTTQNGGPVTGGTSVQFEQTPSGQTATAMYFDYQAVPDFTVSSDGSVTGSSPAHQAGPVDVAITTSAGDVSISFLAFSYGPSVSMETGTTSTAEGGGTATIVGYGLAEILFT